MECSPDVTAFVLAGGKSSRMGTNKAFIEWDGRTLLLRALDLARSVAADVRIVGNRQQFESFAPVVEDIYHDHGPLAGIHAALHASFTELNIMLAVDVPFVSAAFLEYLAAQARKASWARAVVPRIAGRWQPLCAIYRREFGEAAGNALLAGRNRIDLLFGEAGTRVIEQDELIGAGFSPSIFRNLNTPEDLEQEGSKEEKLRA